MVTFVLDKEGKPLMPTFNIKKVRKLLKQGCAKIAGHDPFTIQLLYETGSGTQPVEIAVDTGYVYVGISAKSEKHEYISEERKLLTDEKSKHQAQKRIRVSRRNRLRYRKPRNKRAANSFHTQKERLAPSLEHKANLHTALIRKYMGILPVTSVTLEMGQFDTAVLSAVSEGKPVPEGTAYQYGPKYGYDTLREAVFSRDHYTCAVCGKEAVKDKAVLVIHHIGYRRKDKSDRLGNLLTVCTGCHTSKNHKEGGALWNLKPKSDNLPGAAFMNTVKWHIYKEVKGLCEETHITYGAVTKRTRKDRNITKSHANDAYCIGNFHPKHRAAARYIVKTRRNDRCLERFYDAVYIDIRDGKKKKGAAIGCNRTNRSIPRNNPENERAFRGKKVSAGRRSIRKSRHPLNAGDVVLYKGERRIVRTCRTRHTKKRGCYETVELKSMYGEIDVNKVKVLRRENGWREVTEAEFYKHSA